MGFVEVVRGPSKTCLYTLEVPGISCLRMARIEAPFRLCRGRVTEFLGVAETLDRLRPTCSLDIGRWSVCLGACLFQQ